jgi:hypothetical protein
MIFPIWRTPSGFIAVVALLPVAEAKANSEFIVILRIVTIITTLTIKNFVILLPSTLIQILTIGLVYLACAKSCRVKYLYENTIRYILIGIQSINQR